MTFKKLLIKGTALSLALTTLSCSFVQAASIGFVTGDDVNLRSGDSTEAAVVAKVNDGEQISIIEDLNGWFKISAPSTGEAYITSQFVKVTQADGLINASSVNIRTAPSDESEILGQASQGELLSVNAQVGNWFEIVYKGSTAYVHKDYIYGNLLKYVPETSVQVNTSTPELYAVVNATTLNLRTNADTSASVIKSLTNRTPLTILDISNGWAKVKDNSESVGFVSTEFITLTDSLAPQLETSKGDQVIEFAKQFIGTPYVYGGTSLTSGVDCSGFVYSVFKNFGITLNRTSRDQISNGTRINNKSDLVVGDLVFFNTGGNTAISHVGIYMGNGQYIHSTDGGNKGVTITSLSSDYSLRTYYGACRVLN